MFYAVSLKKLKKHCIHLGVVRFQPKMLKYNYCAIRWQQPQQHKFKIGARLTLKQHSGDDSLTQLYVVFCVFFAWFFKALFWSLTFLAHVDIKKQKKTESKQYQNYIENPIKEFTLWYQSQEEIVDICNVSYYIVIFKKIDKFTIGKEFLKISYFVCR